MKKAIGLAALLVTTASCTFGQVVNDKTDAPVGLVYLDFHEVHTHTHYYVRADAHGQFGFDPELTADTANAVKIAVPEGDYDVSASTTDFCPGEHDYAKLHWDHFTTMPFHHSYDAKCKGSSGDQEPCEAYQVRLSATDPFGAIGPNQTLPPEPTSDDHQGTRIITLFVNLSAPAPTPC
jgi:hypothetical protein